MPSAAEYRQHASECLRLAAATVGDFRGSFRSKSGHANSIPPRQLLTHFGLCRSIERFDRFLKCGNGLFLSRSGKLVRVDQELETGAIHSNHSP